MTAFTSKASGNWSASGTTTWTQAGVPGAGDTATVNHAVAVDTNTTIGTSPNDTTTTVLTIGAAGHLTVNAGITLTIKGNATDNFGSIITLAAGSSISFDASGSGGTPVYNWAAVLSTWAINGSSGSHCAMSAVSGQTFKLTGTIYPTLACTYCDFTRMAVTTWTLHQDGTSYVATTNTFTSCGALTLSSTGTTATYQFNNNTFASGTGSADLTLDISNTFTSGTREFKNNVLPLGLAYTSTGFTGYQNFLGLINGAPISGNWASFTESFVGDVSTDQNRIGRVTTISRVYFAMTGANPHFLAATAHDRNLTVDQCIFEHTSDYATDTGDCIFPYVGTSTSWRVTIQNNIVLPGPDGSTSGTLATHYDSGGISGFANAARTVEYLHNTVFVYGPDAAIEGGIDTAEGQVGHTGEITLIKSNLFWSSIAATGLKLVRQTGTTTALSTASGIDYNASYNLAAGDNGLGYDDRAGSLDLWTGGAATGGNAVANGVDAHTVTSDPQFVDPTRNLAKWCFIRGYGAPTSAAALTALKADTTRITDLLDWVADGFAPQNVSLWHAGHDGATIGAVELAARYGAAARSMIMTQGVLCG